MAHTDAELPLSSASYQILLALADKARHGYAILKAVERQGGPKLGPGTLYAAIRRLEDDGLIGESDWRPDADLDDQRRRYYELTAHGRATLRAETSRLQAMVRMALRKLAHHPKPT